MRRISVRMALATVAVLLSMAVVVDLFRPPERQWTAFLLLAAIDGYQETLSREMAVAGVRCRFEPTCSHYAEAVIRRDGSAVGTWRAARRLARCGPWTPAGTQDQP